MADTHQPPPEERRKRLNLWLIFVVVLVLTALAALALVLLLDDDDQGATSSTTTTAPAVTGTFAPTTPEQYALAFYGTWKANDRAGAARYGSPEAIEELFSIPYTPVQTIEGTDDSLELYSCVHQTQSMLCTWTGELERLLMTVRNAPGLPALVVEVERRGG